jgi:FdhE protein
MVPRALASRFFGRLVRAASRSGTAKMATLARGAADADVLDLLGASVRHDASSISAAAEATLAYTEAFQAVVALLPVPFLQACNAQWASASAHWRDRPYCPTCGSWPAFAEVRGIERSRFYRCGRCGSEWHAHGLSCPYCATTNHRDLVELVPERAGADGFVQACGRCHAYVKALNRLQACDPLAVVVEDLQGAALDVAALEQGYARPAGAARALHFRVVEAVRRRTFAWNG